MKRGRPRKADALADFEQDTFLRGERVHADRIFEVSNDGQRVLSQLDNVVAPQSTTAPAHPVVEGDPRLAGWSAVSTEALDDAKRLLARNVSSYDVPPDPDLLDTKLAEEERKRYQSSDHPMSVWIPQAPLFLDELLRRDGLGDFVHQPACTLCKAANVPMFRCRHCGEFLQCGKCVLAEHARRPLHVIQEWTGDMWKDTDMHAPVLEGGLGLEFQLGHHGFPCPNPATPKRMVVIDSKGIFSLRLRECRCDVGLRRSTVQLLLAHGWYPATTVNPATCATIEALELFRLLRVNGNLNVQDFMGTLQRLTDPGRLRKPLERDKAFFRISRQYGHLLRAKRVGRGHEDNGLTDMAAGDLALACWACPKDGFNLPSGWQDVPESERYRYKLIVAADANFRLKNRLRSNEHQDNALAGGHGYFNGDRYKKHLQHYVSEKDVSSCASFAALLQKDTKSSTGLRVSGVGGVVCARHGLVRRQGMGDLQKGERFANMDFIVLATLEGEKVAVVTVSYDVVCSWKKLLPARAEAIRERGGMTTDLSKFEMQFVLPVWHAAAHELACQTENSISFAVGVGKTDGEGIERLWSLLNPISWSTKEMGEGARHDVLEDKIDFINFEKNTKIGDVIKRKLVVAEAELETQEREYQEMTKSLKKATRREWQRILDAWKADKSQPNPYRLLPGKEAGLTERQIMEQLKEEELAEAVAGRTPLVEGKMTAAAFVKAGLQIEEAQRRIRSELSSKVHVSADRSSEIQELRFSLLKKIKTFKELQLTYMPGVAEIRAQDEELRNSDAPPTKAENVEIYLPSRLDEGQRRGAALRGTIEAEAKLRRGQCADALVSFACRAPCPGASHRLAERQFCGTKERDALRNYRDAWRGLRALKGTALAPEFQELRPEDVNGRTEVENDIMSLKKLREAETTRASRNEPTQAASATRVSWIWKVGGNADSTELHDSVRVDWMRAGARVERWREEVALLREEAKRVMRSLLWIQREWTARATRRQTRDLALANGLRAYALRQVHFHHRVADAFWTAWSKPAKTAVAEFAAEDAALLRSLLEGVDIETLEGMKETVSGGAGGEAGTSGENREVAGVQRARRSRRDEEEAEEEDVTNEGRRSKRPFLVWVLLPQGIQILAQTAGDILLRPGLNRGLLGYLITGVGIFRQYGHLLRAKRVGRGHEEDGLTQMEAGDLALVCWACPKDGFNLPAGWRDVPPSEQYRYKVLIAADANFRLKNRLRSNEHQDRALANGKGYFVGDRYKKHLESYVSEKDVSSCASFAALLHKDTKASTGLRVSGVGGVVCARHGLVRRQGMGDLQKGERYANIDFIILATLEGERVIAVTISYDVVCQWQKLLPQRAQAIRERGGTTTDLSKFKMQYVWHAAAHEVACRTENSISFAVGVGKMDGEGIERLWSLLNPISWSTKEMGEGARHDVLEDKIDFLNFEKNTKIGGVIKRKLIVAQAELETQEREYKELTKSLKKETRQKWQRIYDEWKADKTKPNPFMMPTGQRRCGLTERQIMEHLKEEELAEAAAGRAPLVEGKMTAAAFIKAGLQIEDAQRCIRSELSSKVHVSADRSSEIQELRFSLLKKIKKFKQLQLTYMPGVAEIRAEDDACCDPNVPAPKAENIEIYLPSGLDDTQRRTASLRGANEAEAKLRQGQCSDALVALRAALYVQAHLIAWRNVNSAGQKSATRSSTLLLRVKERIERAATKYRDAWKGLRKLKGPALAPEFKELRAEDVNGRTQVENDIVSMKKLREAETTRASRNEPTQGADVLEPQGPSPQSLLL
ncbi:CxC2 domain-containing protein [Mycena kentingensis (nom. inval.)]|nr:CxC2 domain-containing protein [Mycena kentingensis (nom. inval.)]